MKNEEKNFMIAWELLNQEKHKLALNLYASLPWNEEKFNGVARALVELSRFKEAKKVLMKGLEEYPCSSALWVARGNLSFHLQNYSTALKCYDRAIMLDSHSNRSTALYGKALALENLGRIDEAVKILDSLIEQHPDDCLFLIEKAHCTLKMDNPMGALQLYSQAMDIWRRSGQFHEGLALFTGICSACFNLNMNKEALDVAMRALKELPAHPTLFYNAGRAYSTLGMTKEAVEILKKGLERFPKDKDLKELLNEIDENEGVDSPDGGQEGLIMGTILLALIAHRRHPKK